MRKDKRNNGESAVAQIQLTGVSKTYSIDTIEIPALKNIELSVAEGESLGIIGPSGSGKTTLLNMIGGIDRSTGGNIRVLGKDLDQLSSKQLTKFRKQHYGYIFQFYSLVPSLTALENVTMIMELIGIKGKQLRNEALDMLDLVGLKDRAKNFPHQMSGGERQRVAIARALAKKPDVLFADEPSGQLDSKTSHKVISLMRDVCSSENATLLMVTHDAGLMKYVDRVLELDSGLIVKDAWTDAAR